MGLFLRVTQQLVRNQQVGGSSPLAGSITIFRFAKDLAALPFCTTVVGDQIMSATSDQLTPDRGVGA
jgi:hypothetical protein